MGAYAMYDGKPFRANRETIKLRRKRGMIDRNRELIRNAHLEYDDEAKVFILVKDDYARQGCPDTERETCLRIRK